MFIVRLMFISFWAILLTTSSIAQTSEIIFGSINNDEFNSIISLSDGSYIIVGRTSTINGLGNSDVCIVRLNSSYKVIWSKIYGGIKDDIAYASVMNTNGNIVVTGSSSSFNTVGNSDVFLMEIDLEGNLQWSKTIKTSTYDVTPRKIIKSSAGFIICAMSNYVGTTASPDILIFEVSGRAEVILWQNLIGSTDLSGDIPHSIIESELGGYILAAGTKTFDKGYDQVIMRLTNVGTLSSHVAFGGLDNENAQDVIELANHDIIVMGNFRSLAGPGLEIALTSINENNNINWVKTYGDNGLKDDRPYVFKRNANGEYIMGGFSYSFGNGGKDLILLKISQEGDLLNAYNYPNDGDEQPLDIVLKNNEIIIVGYSSSSSFGMNDAYLFSKKNELDDECFEISPVQNTHTISTHSFNYIQTNPNLILDTVALNVQAVNIDRKYLAHNKILKGKISEIDNNIKYFNLLGVEIGVYNEHLKKIYNLKPDETGAFYYNLLADQKLHIGALLDKYETNYFLMKYRNGFDAFQMENIITNKVNAPLQVEPSPYVMVAADVDLSDKIRSNDISLLQEVIVRKREGFPQQLPDELNKDYLDWRFIDQKTVDSDERFKKSNQYPYYSNKGYCRDNVPDIPFYLSNQGSCDENYTETYKAILLGDLVSGGTGVNLEEFNSKTSNIIFEIDDVHNIGDHTYRVFAKHEMSSQDKFVAFDFTMDYNDDLMSVVNTKMTVEDRAFPHWLSNDYNREELLFTSYSSTGYPSNGNLLYVDIQKSSGAPTVDDLGQLHVFVNGSEVPVDVRLRSQTTTGIDIYKDVSEFVNLYPNPTEGQLTVSLPLAYSEDVHIEIQNTIGQSVLFYEQKQANSNIELDLSILPPGLYQCLISIEDKATVVKKVVVK